LYFCILQDVCMDVWLSFIVLLVLLRLSI